MKHIALYARVSTQEQAKEGYSIGEQSERLQSYCKAMNWKHFKLYVDAGYSGGNLNRPALENMITEIEAGNVEKVVVYKLDRLSRSQKDTLNLIEDVFLARGVDFISMNENFDTSSPFGRAMVGILAVFAQLEREQIKERMTLGREGRAKEGKYHGGSRYPIGYDYIDGELVVNQLERLHILEIFDKYLQGASIRAIQQDFISKGYRHKYGDYDRKVIKKILTSELYTGKVLFDGKWYQGIHEPIIDAATHEQAAALVNQRAEDYKGRRNRSGGYVSALGGLLYCGNCGARYCFFKAYRSSGKIDSYYSCYSRKKLSAKMIKDANCKNPNFTEAELNALVFGEIKKLALEPDKISEISTSTSGTDDRIKILHTEIEKIDSQRSRLMDLYAIGGYTLEEIQAKAEPLNDQKKKLAQEIESLCQQKNTISEEKAVALVTSFADILERGNTEEIRFVVESLIEKIVIQPNGDLVIHWRFA